MTARTIGKVVYITMVLCVLSALLWSQELTITRYSYENTDGDLGSNRVYAMAIQPGTEGRIIWFGLRPYGPDSESRSYEGGLTKLDYGYFGNPTWSHYTTSNSGLPEDWIYDLEFDPDGNLWIATTEEGTAKLDATALSDPTQVAGWTYYNTSTSGIGHDRIYDIAIAPDSTIWFGHGAADVEANAALSIFDGDSQWRVITETNSPLVENTCYAIAITNDGRAWLGHKNQGVFEFDYNGTPFNADDDTWTRHTLVNQDINAGSAAAHPNGDAWFGHSTGYGASHYIASTGEWVNYRLMITDEDGSRIRSIVIDSYGVVWLGDKAGKDEGGSGLWRFDPETDDEPVNVYKQDLGGTALENDDNYVNKVAIDEGNEVIYLASDFYGDDLEVYGVIRIEGLWEPKDTSTTNQVEPILTPSDFTLAQNYPNPFNAGTVIEYSLETSQDVALAVFDIQGRLIRTLVEGFKPSGVYRVHWDGRSQSGDMLPSGIYVLQLQNERGQRLLRKAVLLK